MPPGVELISDREQLAFKHLQNIDEYPPHRDHSNGHMGNKIKARKS